MKIHILLIAFCFSATLAHAQERTAGGALETQMNWSALSTQINTAKTQIKALDSKVTTIDGRVQQVEADIDYITACAKQGLVYAGVPGKCKNPKAPNFSELDLKTYTKTLCSRDRGPFDVIANCPKGQALLTCVGGPGDQGTSHEFWVLQPDFKNNRCIGRVGEPRCFDDRTEKENYYSQVVVNAVCYEPEK